MWKKTESEGRESMAPTTTFHAEPVREQAVIGPSIRVKGDVTGDEDLTIQGEIEGKVTLTENHITVGKNGRVKADLHAKTISVEGNVQGNLVSSEKITIRKTGNVRGNLIAPRVILEDGARFKGTVDMDGTGAEKARASEPAPKIDATAAGDAKSPGSVATQKKAEPTQTQFGLGEDRPPIEK